MVWKAIKAALPAAATAAAGPAAGALVGGTLGLAGAKAAAGYNKKAAREQMAFQERMSSTAYQRAADDLEAAGLNRILAIGSPATTPGGASYNTDFSSMITGAQTGINAASSASNIATQQTQRTQMTAQANKIVQETKNLSQAERRMTVQSDLWETLGPILVEVGTDFGKFVKYIADPQVIGDLKYVLPNAAAPVRKAVDKILSEMFGSRYNQSAVKNIFWNPADDIGKNIPIGKKRNNQ